MDSKAVKKETVSQTTIEGSSNTIQVQLTNTRELEVSLPRPWVRFWARMIDYTLFYLAFLALGSIFFQVSPLFTNTFFWMVLIFLWSFLEAAFLCSSGRTPGKWLLKTSVYTDKHQKLSYGEALSRSFSVWWLGFGAGVPIVSLITMIVAAVKLSNTGVTSWDARGETIVCHEKVGPFRIIMTTIYFALYFCFITWFQMQVLRLS